MIFVQSLLHQIHGIILQMLWIFSGFRIIHGIGFLVFCTDCDFWSNLQVFLCFGSGNHREGRHLYLTLHQVVVCETSSKNCSQLYEFDLIFSKVSRHITPRYITRVKQFLCSMKVLQIKMPTRWWNTLPFEDNFKSDLSTWRWELRDLQLIISYLI